LASRIVSVLVSLVLTSSIASAQQIYKWKDKKGQWHFSDAPPADIKAEQVKGLDIGPIPPMPPQIAEPPIPSGGSESKGQSVSKPATERGSPPSARIFPRRWLLVLSDGKPWDSFNSEMECQRYRDVEVRNAMAKNADPRTGQYSHPLFSSNCISSRAYGISYGISKEANVIVVVNQAGRDPNFNVFVLTGRVFNSGLTTARNVVVKYRGRKPNGKIIQGNIRLVPADLPGLTAAEFKGRILPSHNLKFHKRHMLKFQTEVVWLK